MHFKGHKWAESVQHAYLHPCELGFDSACRCHLTVCGAFFLSLNRTLPDQSRIDPTARSRATYLRRSVLQRDVFRFGMWMLRYTLEVTTRYVLQEIVNADENSSDDEAAPSSLENVRYGVWKRRVVLNRSANFCVCSILESPDASKPETDAFKPVTAGKFRQHIM